MTHLTYLESAVVGLIQGVSEMFPVSSLGHNVLIPAIVGGSWARDLNVSAAESPYLAFIVGLHVATAIALLVYFWRDWVRIIGGFFSSLRDRRVETADQKLAWMIILATIPVGIVGVAVRAHLPGALRQADPGRDLPHRERRDPPGRGALPDPRAPLARRRGASPQRSAEPRRRRRRSRCRENAPELAVRHGGPGASGAGAAARQPTRPAARAGSLHGRRAGRRRPGRPAAGLDELPAGRGHRVRADPGAAGRHQPGRRHHGRRHGARTVPRGRRQVRVPARHARHPGRRRAEDPGPARPARQRDPRPDPAGQRAVRASAPTCRSGSCSGTCAPEHSPRSGSTA